MSQERALSLFRVRITARAFDTWNPKQQLGGVSVYCMVVTISAEGAIAYAKKKAAAALMAEPILGRRFTVPEPEIHEVSLVQSPVEVDPAVVSVEVSIG